MDRRGSCRSRIPVQVGCAHDDVVAHVAAVATTLAATLVAFNTFNPLHQRLIDDRMLHVVLVLMLITATLGPVLTQYVAPYMLDDSPAKKALNA
jgi:hypothetical protein